MKRSIAALAATAGLLVFASTAVAGEAPPTDTSTTTTPPATTTTTTSTPATTTTTVPATTTTTVPATTTTVPTTTVPTTTTTTTVPTTTDGPTTTGPCVVDCVPVDDPIGDPCLGPGCVPGTPIGGAGGVPTTYGAGRSLPFTGIEDTILPILLALVVVLGGVVAWRWAQLREAVAEAAIRARRLPARQARTGFDGALRQLQIEQRARQVFVPRVA